MKHRPAQYQAAQPYPFSQSHAQIFQTPQHPPFLRPARHPAPAHRLVAGLCQTAHLPPAHLQPARARYARLVAGAQYQPHPPLCRSDGGQPYRGQTAVRRQLFIPFGKRRRPPARGTRPPAAHRKLRLRADSRTQNAAHRATSRAGTAARRRTFAGAATTGRPHCPQHAKTKATDRPSAGTGTTGKPRQPANGTNSRFGRIIRQGRRRMPRRAPYQKFANRIGLPSKTPRTGRSPAHPPSCRQSAVQRHRLRRPTQRNQNQPRRKQQTD